MKIEYGVFYKSEGKWHGPYKDKCFETREEALELLEENKDHLKKQVSVWSRVVKDESNQ